MDAFWLRDAIHKLEHQLQAHDDFIKLVIAKLWASLAEIRPRMHIISHHLDRIAVDIVVQTAGNGMDAVVAKLAWV
jgi:hypothetical protein